MWSPHFEVLSQHVRLIAPDLIGLAGRSFLLPPGTLVD